MTVLFISSCRSDLSILRYPIKYFQKYSHFKCIIYIGGYNFDNKSSGNNKLDKMGFKNIIFSKNSKIKNFDYKDTNVANFIINEVKDIIKKKNIKYIFILGDRFEIASLAINLVNSPVKLFHLHGGEITKGSNDNTYRYIISKCSHYHFVSTLQSKERLIKQQFKSNSIYNIGSLALDSLSKIKKFKDIKIINKKFNINLVKKKYIVVSLHPETISNIDYNQQINILFKSIKNIKSNFIFTSPSPDTGREFFIKKIKIECKKNSNYDYIENLGYEFFYDLLMSANLFIGNSSAGIIESIYFNIPFINIGTRQLGREYSKNIINVKWNTNSIKSQINKFLLTDSHNFKLSDSFYYKKNSVNKLFQKFNKIITK